MYKSVLPTTLGGRIFKKGLVINKFKIEKIKLLNRNAKIVKYKLFTENKELILNISKNDTSKVTMIEFTKIPFYILTYKNIDDEINVDDSFEISNNDSTLELECLTTCGIDFKSENIL